MGEKMGGWRRGKKGSGTKSTCMHPKIVSYSLIYGDILRQGCISERKEQTMEYRGRDEKQEVDE